MKVGRSIAYKVNGECAVIVERKDSKVSNCDWSKQYSCLGISNPNTMYLSQKKSEIAKKD